MYRLKRLIVNNVPESLICAYHLTLAYIGAWLYNFPSHRIIVVGVTGTKGKSSTTEMVNAIFEEAGYTTAVLNSIRIKIGDQSEPNVMRMSMPGRFYIQRFLSQAEIAGLRAFRGVPVAILEMTSEGARQNRHRAIELDALIFTNLAPEHIESHGSYRAYADAKFEIAKALMSSPKRPRIVVANSDDPESSRYIMLPIERALPFSLRAQRPYEANDRGGHFRFDASDINVHLPGEFSLKNALAAATLARAFGIHAHVIASALDKLTTIPGRTEHIEAGQDFSVIVDYAHTPDSLEALYDAFASKRKICVLGSTGGGRDLWKRPEMGKVADLYCDHVILTNEDPYDEDPRSIVDGVARGMKRAPEIIMDRREAISKALSTARSLDAVLITGKGTDPNIALARGKKLPWSDAGVAREEIEKLLQSKRIIQS